MKLFAQLLLISSLVFSGVVVVAQFDINTLLHECELQVLNKEYKLAQKNLDLLFHQYPENYKVNYYLADLNLYHALATKDKKVAKKSLITAQDHNRRMSFMFDRDLDAFFRTVLIELENAKWASNYKAKQTHLVNAFKVINHSLAINMTDEKMWFAQGEWWYVIAQLNKEELVQLQKAIPQSYELVLPRIKRGIYDKAATAYTNSLCYRTSSIYGHYGTIKTFLAMGDCETANQYYKDVWGFSHYYPIEQHFAQAIETIWSECAKDEELMDEYF